MVVLKVHKRIKHSKYLNYKVSLFKFMLHQLYGVNKNRCVYYYCSNADCVSRVNRAVQFATKGPPKSQTKV